MGVTLDLQAFILRARSRELLQIPLLVIAVACYISPWLPKAGKIIHSGYFMVLIFGGSCHLTSNLVPFLVKVLKEIMVVLAIAVELQQTIRQEIEKNRDCQDKQKIRFLLSEGKERVKRLDEMLDMQGC
uniref:Complex 1 LYR protein domain-containing protein n=1 Tax=Chenopodium quinoa TaxID=63459 RepID=A0A803LIT7_CHEQI